MKPLASEAEAEQAARSLGGTCLTRAMAIAALLPGSQIVIAATGPSTFGAHAWVESRGVAIMREPVPADGGPYLEIVRLG